MVIFQPSSLPLNLLNLYLPFPSEAHFITTASVSSLQRLDCRHTFLTGLPGGHGTSQRTAENHLRVAKCRFLPPEKSVESGCPLWRPQKAAFMCSSQLVPSTLGSAPWQPWWWGRVPGSPSAARVEAVSSQVYMEHFMQPVKMSMVSLGVSNFIFPNGSQVLS